MVKSWYKELLDTSVIVGLNSCLAVVLQPLFDKIIALLENIYQ
jgi:hypothetical protein